NLINRAPNIALQEAQDEIQNIGHMTFDMFRYAKNYNDKTEKDIIQKHVAVESMYDNERQYLTKIYEKKIYKQDSERMSVLFDVNRIFIKIASLKKAYLLDLKKKEPESIQISAKAEQSIERLYDHVDASLEKTID